MSQVLEGGCLCGAVRYGIATQPVLVGNCYCTDCRKSSGTTHCTHAVVPEGAFSVTGSIKVHDRPADSGNIVSRGFCPECGSAILSHNNAMPGMVFVRVSSLDDPDAVEPQMTVYASRAPAWAMLDRTRPVLDEMPEGGPQRVMAEL